MFGNNRTTSAPGESGRRPAMRRGSLLLMTAALAVAVGIGAAWGAGGGKADVYALGEAGDTMQKGIITVTGQGELQAAPDVAYVNVGVDTSASTAKEAQANNATQFAALEKVLFEKYKLAQKDVKTTSFNVQPQYQYNNNDGSRKLTGYTAMHSVQITMRDLDSVGPLLDSLSAAGANRVDGITFDTEKQDQYELQALDKAMANAKAKAETLAKSAGKQLGDAVNITQNGASATPIFHGPEMAAAADSAGGAATSVQTGEISLSANVTVSYEMK